MNQIIDNILSRRSIRSFQDKQISKDDLNTILMAGSYAPSGMGMQSWKFTAIQNKEVMAQVNDAIIQTLLTIPEDHEAYSYFARHIHKAEQDQANFLYLAPTYIIVSNLKDNNNSMADSALAIGNMMLAAHSLGIGSCWLNQLPRLSEFQTMRNFLSKISIPKDHMVFGSVVMGYPAVEVRTAAPRKDVINIID